ncbi:MAG: tyrosine-type recombinase/integrase [Theionarchaea archaeon]|nr:tyrosine-type recombinase/integrase [Theionarchaea archaeon]
MSKWRDELMGNENLQALRDHIALKSESTQFTYLYAVKQICDFFGIAYREFDPHGLDQEKYDTFLGTRTRELKRTSLNLLSNVYNILSDLYSLGIKIKLLEEIDRHTDYITFAELQEIINKADKEAAAIAAFLFCTGLRPVSVLSVKKEQLMLNAKHPYIKGVYLKGGRRQDIIIMYPDLVKPLLNWYMQYKTSKVKGYDKIEHVFVSQRGRTTESYIYTLIRKCNHILGRNLCPRMFRKGLGVHTKELGLQDEVRRMIMAHKDVKTTIDAYSDYTIKDIVRELTLKVPQSEGITGVQPVQNQQTQTAQERCPFCGGAVESEMLLCPHCWEEIKIVCDNCKRFVQVNWKKCPYCGMENENEKKEKYKVALK